MLSAIIKSLAILCHVATGDVSCGLNNTNHNVQNEIFIGKSISSVNIELNYVLNKRKAVIEYKTIPTEWQFVGDETN